MERETKTIKTPGGHDVILKSYLTGRETKAITDKDSLKNIDTQSTANIPVGMALDFANEVVRATVISIDGKIENPLDIILDLPSIECNFIQQECIGIYNLGFPKVK
jgi:hypothetical protein